MPDPEQMSQDASETKRTQEAEMLADSILRAAGSGLRHYTMASGRGFILAAARSGIADAQDDLLKTLRWIAFEADDLNSAAESARAALAKAGA